MKKILAVLRLCVKYWKDRKLRRAIRKANQMHRMNNKKYYVFRLGKKYAVVNNDDIKFNKDVTTILPKNLNAYELMKRCNYQTK